MLNYFQWIPWDFSNVLPRISIFTTGSSCNLFLFEKVSFVTHFPLWMGHSMDRPLHLCLCQHYRDLIWSEITANAMHLIDDMIANGTQRSHRSNHFSKHKQTACRTDAWYTASEGIFTFDLSRVLFNSISFILTQRNPNEENEKMISPNRQS